MAPEIRELDAETRDRIAAGEVIERPASVVKELLENAIDADADRIAVSTEAGGIDRIVVADDGVGMTESEARLAVEEHTTSKLRSVEDLDALGTLGFRGEALHAIGSVSRVRIETKPSGASRGTALVVEHGELQSCGPTGCPEGTTVEVTGLFGNVPARRKYLKTEATEFDHIARITTGYALAQPDVAISLARDDRETFATAGDGDRRSAVMAVYGRDVASAMVPVEYDGSGPLSSIEGLVSHPETNRAGREYVTTLVDGRYVNASAIGEALVDAYGHQLAPDRFPFAVLDVQLPPGSVDVNVHPRKLEVLFANEVDIKAAVTDAVESALTDAGLIRSSAPRGRSAADQTQVSPGGSADDQAVGDDSLSESDAASEGESASPAVGETDAAGSSHTVEHSTTNGGAAASSPDESAGVDRSASIETGSDRGSSEAHQEESPPASAGSESVGHRRANSTTQKTLDGSETTGTPDTFEQLPPMTVLGQFDDTYLVAEADDGLLLIDQHAADERVNYERLQSAVDGGVTAQNLTDSVPVSVTAREAALVSEYAEALERLGFEVRDVERSETSERASGEGRPARSEGDRREPSEEVSGEGRPANSEGEQSEPSETASGGRPDGRRMNERRSRESEAASSEGDRRESSEIASCEAASSEDERSEPSEDPTSQTDRSISVTTVPAFLAEHAGEDAPEIARDLLGEFVDGDPEGTIDSVVDDVLGDLACHPSITGNTSLREGTVTGLLSALDECENPYACPHGRPTLIEVSTAEIEDRFERDYPGHADRRQ